MTDPFSLRLDFVFARTFLTRDPQEFHRRDFLPQWDTSLPRVMMIQGRETRA
jgi:hypothetical protein